MKNTTKAIIYIKAVLSSILYRVIFLLSRAVLVVKPGKRHGSKKRILFIKLDAIGDFILWLDSAKELRRIFPADACEITLLGNRLWSSLAGKTSYFDEVWPLDKSRFLFHPIYRIRILANIRRSGFDTVVAPTYSREFFHDDAVVNTCGAPERIGSEGDCSNVSPRLKKVADRWYTRLVPATKKPLMELERNAEFLRGMGIPDFRSGVPVLPVLEAPPGMKPPSERYIIFPGAGLPIRRWSTDNFIGLAGRIHRATGWAGFVCGGPGEERLGDAIVTQAGVPMVNMIGSTSLEELASFISGARLLVGNETGAIHMAAAVGTPSVCILGGGHFGRFMPYGTEVEAKKTLPSCVAYKMNCFHCNWKCIYKLRKGEAAPCIANIHVDMVWESVEKLLAGRR